MDNFIGIDNWEKEHELKLSVEEGIMSSIRKDLGIYAPYIDYQSVEFNIMYESNYLEFDILVPKSFIAVSPHREHFNKEDVLSEIRYFIGDNIDSGIGGTFTKTSISIEEHKKIWKVHVYRHWGLDV